MTVRSGRPLEPRDPEGEFHLQFERGYPTVICLFSMRPADHSIEDLPTTSAMLHSLRARSLVLPLLVLAGSCASTEVKSQTDADSHAKPETREESDPKKIDDLKHQHAVASAKLKIANMELGTFEEQSGAELDHNREELEMTKSTLDNFVKVEMPTRLAAAELSLQAAKDSAVESAEELAQLEIMYKDQDLHDMTAEFVISRGERRAERAAKRIQIQEQEFNALVQHELPMELRRHEIAVARSEQALAKSKAEAEIAKLGKELKILEATHARDRSEQALEEAHRGEEH
jgi:hypothetical protein